MMKRMTWILIGVAIGGVSTAAGAGAVRQQTSTVPRVTVAGAANIPEYNGDFIRDTRNGACWLLLRSHVQDGPVALAPAPESSCYQR